MKRAKASTVNALSSTMRASGCRNNRTAAAISTATPSQVAIRASPWVSGLNTPYMSRPMAARTIRISGHSGA